MGISRIPFALRRCFPAVIPTALGVVALSCAIVLPSFAGTTTYVYDVHGRIQTVTSPNGTDQTIATYSYDDAGNREVVQINVVDVTPPNPPTNLTASALASDRIRLSWTTSIDVGGGPVSYYRVYRGGDLVASPNGPPFEDWPLAANTSYTYRVSAVDPSNNESSLSAEASATTLPGADLVAPSTPANLQGSAVSATQVNLTWSPSTDTGGSGLAGYEIYRDNAPLGTSPVASYADTTAGACTTRLYKVRAYDGAQNFSGFSNEISVTTPDTCPPSAPGNPTFGAITGGTAWATWTAASDNVGVTGYRHSLNGGASWTDVGNVLSANLTGLSANTPYTLLVQARDAYGNWGASGSGSFTTSAYYTDLLQFNPAWTGDGWSTPLMGGYWPGFGSLTPNTLSGGTTIAALYSYSMTYFDEWGQPYAWENYTQLTVTGFNGDPGAGWLQSIGGLTGATAVHGCSSSTQCWWYWPDYAGVPDPGTLTVVHQ